MRDNLQLSREAAEGFDKLDESGVIREIENTDERIKAICDLHIGAVPRKEQVFIRAVKVLVLTPRRAYFVKSFIAPGKKIR